MKKLLPLITLLSLLWLNCKTQNLVPNPSFENYDTCPYDFQQIEFATGWFNVTPSSDLFNSCSNNPDINIAGLQVPVTENCHGYSGFIEYVETFNYREYFAAQLISPLVIGVKYYMSFYINLSDNSNCGINKIGLVFTNSPLHYSNTMITNFLNYAHLYSSVVITDKNNWTRIYGAFVADSNYKYINVGSFFDNNKTDTIKFDNLNCFSYYFVDDICVSPDSLTCNPGIEICSLDVEEINSTNLFNVYPNPFKQITTIKINEIQQPFDVKIYDIFGKDVTTQIIYTVEIISKGVKIIIDKNKLINGIYILKISTKNKTYNSRLIIN